MALQLTGKRGKGGVETWALLLVGMLFGVISQAAEPPTAQIDQGRDVYRAQCSACHGETLEGGPGGPPVSGTAFTSKWAARPKALLEFVRTSMPPGAAGSLDPADYVAVSAFLLNQNGVRAALPQPQSYGASAAKGRHSGANVAVGAAGNLPAPLAPAGRLTEAKRLATLAELRPVTDEMLRDPPQGDWLLWRRTYTSQGFSNLAQINRNDVGRLRQVWSWQLAPGDNEITPLVHDGVLFIASSGHVDALNAATGDLLWQYVRPGDIGLVRNLAIYGSLVYLAADTSVVALDMRTGRVVWDKQIAPSGVGPKVTAGPLAAKGKIFQGMSFCTGANSGSCFIVALDAKTGAEIWRRKTIAQPGQQGGDTWNDTPAAKRAGGAVWTTPSYDPRLNLIFVGTGNTYQTDNLQRGKDRAAGLYTDTTLALRPDTGELVWYFQHLAGDIWDLDWSFERTLARMKVDGVSRLTVTTGGKLGIFDTLDAATGKYLFSNDVGFQNLVASIDPTTGAKHIDPAMVPTVDPVLVCPGGLGGRNWPATAYNPSTGVLFIPYNDTCMRLRGGLIAEGGAVLPDPRNPEGLIGGVKAIDLVSHKTLWQRRGRSPHASAILATAGGLVFDGTRDRWFRALDERTGKTLWQTRLDSTPSSYPITYSVDGVQYVAVVAGGGNFVDTLIGQLTPEIVTPIGRPTLWVFRLPKHVRAPAARGPGGNSDD